MGWAAFRSFGSNAGPRIGPSALTQGRQAVQTPLVQLVFFDPSTGWEDPASIVRNLPPNGIIMLINLVSIERMC